MSAAEGVYAKDFAGSRDGEGFSQGSSADAHGVHPGANSV